ncbi:MAG: hypothetical protein JWN46_2630 [Acidimicrobiales bacterium]|nr:hypothetical protein [Acidimicrobiales bacterium]
MPRRPTALFLALALSAALLGCAKDAGSSPTSSAACAKAAGSAVTLVARNVKWSVDCISVPAPGKLQITMRSYDQAAHNVHVTGHGVNAKTTLEAGPVTQHLTVDLPTTGDYQFICDLHELQMKGTILVG